MTNHTGPWVHLSWSLHALGISFLYFILSRSQFLPFKELNQLSFNVPWKSLVVSDWVGRVLSHLWPKEHIITGQKKKQEPLSVRKTKCLLLIGECSVFVKIKVFNDHLAVSHADIRIWIVLSTIETIKNWRILPQKTINLNRIEPSISITIKSLKGSKCLIVSMANDKSLSLSLHLKFQVS